MLTRSCRTILTLALAMGLTPLAHAKKLTISMEQWQTINRSEATRSNPGETWYQSHSKDAQVKSAIRGEGFFAVLNKDKSEPNTQVIGVDVEGYDRTRFDHEGNGRVFMSREYRIVMPVPGASPIVLEKSYRVPVTIENGTWEAYLAGQTVGIVFSKEATQKSEEVIASSLEESMKTLLRSFQAKGLKTDDVKVDVIESTPNHSQLNLTSFIQEGGTVHVKVSFKVESPL